MRARLPGPSWHSLGSAAGCGQIEGPALEPGASDAAHLSGEVHQATPKKEQAICYLPHLCHLPSSPDTEIVFEIMLQGQLIS